MAQLQYYDSKVRLIPILLGGCALVGIGLWLVIANPEPSGAITKLITFDGKLTQVWGGIAVTFFGVCIAKGLQMLFDKSPRIVLSDDGVMDRSLCKAVIPWSQIEDAQVTQVMKHSFICLFLKDPEKYLSKLTLLMRINAGANKAMVGTAYTMNLAAINADPETICQEIRARIQR